VTRKPQDQAEVNLLVWQVAPLNPDGHTQVPFTHVPPFSQGWGQSKMLRHRWYGYVGNRKLNGIGDDEKNHDIDLDYDDNDDDDDDSKVSSNGECKVKNHYIDCDGDAAGYRPLA